MHEVVYDCFGDLKGFELKECCGEQHFFESHERSLGDLVLRTCRESLRVTVYTRPDRRETVCEIRIGC